MYMIDYIYCFYNKILFLLITMRYKTEEQSVSIRIENKFHSLIFS